MNGRPSPLSLAQRVEEGLMTTPVPRSDFPILGRTVRGGHPLVYLDSAATAHKPSAVLDAERAFYERSNGAVNRGSHLLAEEATEAFESARATIAAFVGVDPDEIIWTKNATEAINVVTYAMSNVAAGRGGIATKPTWNIGPGDSIVVTEAEHHANLIPWQELAARTGATLTWIKIDDDGRLDLSTLDVITPSTKVVAFTHISNVTGAISPIQPIVDAAQAVGAMTVLDACQSVPHMPVNFYELGIDLAAFSGHKMLGPTGVGALYARRGILDDVPPVWTGGSMVETVTMSEATYAPPPTRFEAGTQMVAQAVGMAEAARYLSHAGMGEIARHEDHLMRRLLDGMIGIEGIRIIGPADPDNRIGTVAFAVDGVHPHDVGAVLDAQGIEIRVGHHCAQPIHKRMGTFASSRASLGPYNNEADVDAFLSTLETVRPYFGV